ncbi:hypothetical protein [Candidatus Cytomitobacter primus]|uniref:Uncharacterized protein n=1 Tax=Candidatus Cytomitobacter primus TaxID=2066024 RepID=A0A5C0UHA8_9PROT|nr:hypothetical protein [Candidatus Cytomitobacter primus]QEK38434.1 hypothetical protein FZC34_00675 [Candidatus Cytomitobacter primus]
MNTIHMPVWDFFLTDQIKKHSASISVQTWSPELTNKSKLNPYELIRQAFPNETDNFFISFMFYGRNYFAPPTNEKDAYELLKTLEGKRTKIYYAIKKANQKHKIAEEWIMVKRMSDEDREIFAPKLMDYQNFLRLSGQSIILKSGSKRNALSLLYNNGFLQI